MDEETKIYKKVMCSGLLSLWLVSLFLLGTLFLPYLNPSYHKPLGVIWILFGLFCLGHNLYTLVSLTKSSFH